MTLDRAHRFYFDPERDFPPRLSVESYFRDRARTAHLCSLAFHTDYRTADLVRLALENVTSLTALTLCFTDLAHEGDPELGSKVMMLAVRGESRQKIVTPFSLYVPREPKFRLRYFETDHPGDDSLRRFINLQPSITHLGPLSNVFQLNIGPFPSVIALSSDNPNTIVLFGTGRKIEALECHAKLRGVMTQLVGRGVNPACLPSIVSISLEEWPDMGLLERLFPNLRYLQVFAQPSERPEDFRSTFKRLERIRLSWILPTSSLIYDFFVWFPSLRLLEVFDKEDIYVTHWTRTSAWDVIRVGEEAAHTREWSTWIMQK